MMDNLISYSIGFICFIGLVVFGAIAWTLTKLNSIDGLLTVIEREHGQNDINQDERI